MPRVLTIEEMAAIMAIGQLLLDYKAFPRRWVMGMGGSGGHSWTSPED